MEQFSSFSSEPGPGTINTILNKDYFADHTADNM